MFRILRTLMLGVFLIGTAGSSFAVEKQVWKIDGIYYTNVFQYYQEPKDNEVCVTSVPLHVPSEDNPYLEEIYSGDIVIPPFVEISGKKIPVTRVDKQAFEYSKVNSVILPTTVKSIGSSAFYGSSLRHISMPGVDSLEYWVFKDCKNLETLTLPASYTKTNFNHYSDFPFIDIPNLKNFEVEEGNPEYSTYEGVLYNKDKTKLIIFPQGREAVRFPDTLEEISSHSFDNSKLTSIDFPSSIKIIGNQAFCRTTKLRSVIIPAAVEYVGTAAFSESGLERFEDLSLSDNKVGFSDCQRLSSVTLSPEMKEIWNNMFYNCKSLRQIVIPDKVERIGINAFAYAGIPGGMKSVTLGKSVKEISKYAFDLTDILNLTCLATVPPEFNDYYNPLDEDFPRANYGFKWSTFEECNLYVPAEALEAYKTAEVWRIFKNIRPIAGAAVDALPDDGAAFTINGSTLSVEAESGTVANIYSIDGKLLFTKDNGQAEIELPSGLYILQIGAKSHRIRIR